MSLFSITRYTGDEIQTVNNENDILNSLKKKSKRSCNIQKKQNDVVEPNFNKRKRSYGQISQDQALEESNIDKKKKSNMSTINTNVGMKCRKKEKDMKTVCVEESEEDDEKSLSNSHTDETCDGSEGIKDKEEFTIMGQISEKTFEKVKRVLPRWLSKPSIVQSDIVHNTTPLADLTGMDHKLLQRIKANGINSYFPVQAQIIPVLLESVCSGFLTGHSGYRPSDICCSAPTGSGKTLAYVLPLLQALKERVTCHIRALVVLPVQDLAVQVYKVFQAYSKGLKVKVGCVTGNVPLHQEKSILVKKGPRRYQSNIDILIATPGRLVDHIHNTEGFSLNQLRFLIIDEADRMTEEIKQDWLLQVESAVYKDGREYMGPCSAINAAKCYMPVQKLLFSATLSQNPEKLQQLGLFQPKLFTSVVGDLPSTEISEENVKQSEIEKGDFIGKYTTPAGLKEYFYETDSSEKPLAMLYFLKKMNYKQVMCFTNSIETTHRLYWLVKLVGGVEVAEFSSKLNSNKRSQLLMKFQRGKIDMLICSDAMARGMDIENVQYVISYESPPFIKTYIHRAGRTARAGKEGTAITLLENKEIHHFKKMLEDAGKTVKEKTFKPYAFKQYIKPLKKALTELPNKLDFEKHQTSEKRK